VKRLFLGLETRHRPVTDDARERKGNTPGASSTRASSIVGLPASKPSSRRSARPRMTGFTWRSIVDESSLDRLPGA